MEIIGRSPHTPTSGFEWVMLLVVLSGIAIGVSLASDRPSAALMIFAAVAFAYLDASIAVPIGIALAGGGGISLSRPHAPRVSGRARAAGRDDPFRGAAALRGWAQRDPEQLARRANQQPGNHRFRAHAAYRSRACVAVMAAGSRAAAPPCERGVFLALPAVCGGDPLLALPDARSALSAIPHVVGDFGIPGAVRDRVSSSRTPWTDAGKRPDRYPSPAGRHIEQCELSLRRSQVCMSVGWR